MGIAGELAVRASRKAVERYERTHAFTTPDDAGLWVLLPDKTGEGMQIMEPFLP